MTCPAANGPCTKAPEYTPAYGPELIENGEFVYGLDDWLTVGDITHVDGEAHLDGSTGLTLLYQTVLTYGVSYEVSILVTQLVGLPHVIDNAGLHLHDLTEGLNVFSFTQAELSPNFIIKCALGSEVFVDNISVREVMTSVPACIEPKTYATLPQFAGVFIQGFSDHFVVTWDTPVSYPGYTVTMLIRPSTGGHTLPRQICDRDDGTITSHLGLTEGEFYEVWGRVETPTLFGDWVKKTVLISPAWTSNSAVVEHLGVGVLHGEAIILIG